MTGRRRFFWFPQDLVENDRISYQGADGVASWKQIVGFQSLKAKDGRVPIRNWHFGVEAVPRVGFETFISLLPHVVFSEDGHVYDSKKKQHACRRRQCRRWYNNDWRDRILATLHFLQNKGDELRIRLAPESFGTFKAEPTVFESPVTYARTVDVEEPVEHELEAHPEAEIEDEGDDDRIMKSMLRIKEPRLEFGYQQELEDPRDGLNLFGPYDRGLGSAYGIRAGVIGTQWD